ncbi:hypothetical protein MKW92_017987 [Papaver armeniacum]|nr:hypothetical protein MKW92_017987 [Papaver armeniacum]
MAGGFVHHGGTNGEGFEYRITSYFVFACIVAALGGSLFGYDLGVSGGVTSMDDFLKDFFPKVYRRKQEHLNETDYCKYDNQILTLFTSSLYFAGLISTFAASHVTRTRGRRGSIMVGSVSFFVGAIFNAFAVNISMLIIGRIFLGIGIGFGNQAVPLYLSEMAPAKIRGAVNQLFQLTTCLGILVANFVNYGTNKIHPWGWRLYLPSRNTKQSCRTGKIRRRRRVLEKVRGVKNVDAEFADLIEASEAARAITQPFRNLLQPKNRPQLIIGGLGIPAFQQLTGMNSILFYAPVIFQSLGFGSGATLYSSIITSTMLVVATFVSMAVVDKFGRRFLFIEAGCQMILSMLVLAIILALKFGHGVELSKGYAVVLVIMICLFVAAYGWSWGPLGWLVPSELFPLETRSAGQSLVVSVNLFFTAAIAQCFLVSLCHLRYGIFLLFAGLILIMSLFIYFLLPETKQVPIEEIHLLFQNHWLWKKYIGDGKTPV